MAGKGLRAIGLLLTAALALSSAASAGKPSIALRGHDLTLISQGVAGARPIVLSSGDGGWIHLAPHVATVLASHGYEVIGVDTRAYLEAFTTERSSLRPEHVQADYRQLTDYARAKSGLKPVLVGVSEGAGLSVLAASSPSVQATAAGVVALGLSSVNELAWRWKDSIVYLTHGVPREPTFRVEGVIAQVSPLPLAAIHSTHDEFSALPVAEHLMTVAREPRRLWVVPASDHRFSDNLTELDRRLLDAVGWVVAHEPAS